MKWFALIHYGPAHKFSLYKQDLNDGGGPINCRVVSLWRFLSRSPPVSVKAKIGQEFPNLRDEDLVALVARYFDIPAKADLDVKKFGRSASVVWRVTMSDPAESQTFFVKACGPGGEKHARLVNRANAVMANSAEHAASEIYFDPEYGVVVSRAASGQTIASLMRFSLKSNPMHWFQELERSMRAAGEWLRLYHYQTRSGRISEALGRYLELRKEALDRLTPENRRNLFHLIGDNLRDDLVVTHGDYAPENLLWNGKQISAIDYGIQEWTEMSPHWDSITFLIMLDRYSLFSLRSPLFSCRPLLHRLKRSFLDAYGAPLSEERRTVRACLAVRHFSLAFGSNKHGCDRRSLWHLKQMERILRKSAFLKDDLTGEC